MMEPKPVIGGVCAKLGKTHNGAIAYRVGFIVATLIGFVVITPIVYGGLWLYHKHK